MEICKNCGYSLEQPGTACPNCGYYPKPPKTRKSLPDWALILFGFLTAIASTLILPILGPLILTAVYYSIKDKQEMYARGMGYGLLTVVVLILGGIALCFAMVFSGSFKF